MMQSMAMFWVTRTVTAHCSCAHPGWIKPELGAWSHKDTLGEAVSLSSWASPPRVENRIVSRVGEISLGTFVGLGK